MLSCSVVEHSTIYSTIEYKENFALSFPASFSHSLYVNSNWITMLQLVMALKNIQTHHEIKIILPINAHQNHAHEVNTILLLSAIYRHIYNRINNNCIEYAAFILVVNTSSSSASIFNYSLMFCVFCVFIHFTMSFALFLCCFLFYEVPSAVLLSSFTLSFFCYLLLFPSLSLHPSLSFIVCILLFCLFPLSPLFDLHRPLFYRARAVLFLHPFEWKTSSKRQMWNIRLFYYHLLRVSIARYQYFTYAFHCFNSALFVFPFSTVQK